MPAGMNLRERVGLNIQDTRRLQGISQEVLALRADVNRGYMGKIENAKNSMTLDMLEKISKALDIDPKYLLNQRSQKK